jgi:hypothetical protein
MPDIVGGDQDLVARLTDRGRACRQDDVGVEDMLMSGRNPLSTSIGPKDHGLPHVVGRDR